MSTVWEKIQEAFKKVKTWLTRVPGAPIGWGLVAGAVLFSLLKHQGVISFKDFATYFTMNVEQIRKANMWPMILSPFAHLRWDILAFSSVTAILTTNAVSKHLSVGNQLLTFFSGHALGCRLALTLYPNGNNISISGLAPGLAALEGYSIAHYRRRGNNRRMMLYSAIRVVLGTLCFIGDLEGSTSSGDMVFKNFAFLAQVGGLLAGLAYGELYGTVSSLGGDQPDNATRVFREITDN